MSDDLIRVFLYLMLLLFVIDLFMLALIFYRDMQIDRLEQQVKRLSPPATFKTKGNEHPWTY
ncbi:MAG: hypothetical protein IH587_03295 [Anaerolineae bacterium]|nr:hypothetical protein [Anaerolineae bacterium]